MPAKQSQRDPIRAHQRMAIAARRAGENTQCACGEARPHALIAGSNPTMCAECQRKNKGQTVFDDHHVAGKANSPVTVQVPVNDHRAYLSPAQCDWSRETRENPDRSPLLAGAACVRGFIDTLVYLVNKCLLWIAEALEWLNEFLVERFKYSLVIINARCSRLICGRSRQISIASRKKYQLRRNSEIACVSVYAACAVSPSQSLPSPPKTIMLKLTC